MVRYCVVFLLIITTQFSCKKLVEVSSPVNLLTSDNVYTSDATAAAVLTGVYTTLANASPLGAGTINSISLLSGLSADELTLYSGSANANAALAQFYFNALTSGFSVSPSPLWANFYSKLYVVNLALERLAVSNNLTPSVKRQLIGEAKFLRAFFYFYLVNLYGDVPLTTSSDYRINLVLSRSPKVQVYQQIISDLKDAQNLMSDGYVAADAKNTTTERTRPNSWAATALLARAYLYTGKYDSAELQSTAVINNAALYDTTSLNNVFLKNSHEAIWQLQPVNTGWNTEDARVFVLPSTGPTSNSSVVGYPAYVSAQLLDGFEATDQRKMNWIDSVTVNGITYYYPFKYKSATLNAPVTEYLMILRLGEQYLIRAEARAWQNKIQDAQSDLNIIRTRARLSKTTANDKISLLAAIMHERKLELFTEWGHRWLDLKRTNTIDAVMNTVAPTKGITWSTNWQLYPIPLYDITQDPNLQQNPGYN